MAKNIKNGLLGKIIGGVATGIVLLILAILLKWGPAIQDNAHATEVNTNEIKRVDSKVDALIMEQKAFIKDTTKVVGEIKTSVAVIEERTKPHNP